LNKRLTSDPETKGSVFRFEFAKVQRCS